MVETDTIWIVEDDDGARFVYDEVLGGCHELHFFSAYTSFKAQLQNAKANSPALVIADMKLPEGNFCDLLEESVRTLLGETPIVVVSSLDDVETVKRCLRSGYQDYMVKPFRPNELIAKVEHHLARPKSAAASFNLDSINLTLSLGEASPVSLTPKEVKILAIFRDNPGDVRRDELFRSVWPSAKVGRKTLDTHLFNLRRKIRPLGLDIVFHEPDVYRLETFINKQDE